MNPASGQFRWKPHNLDGRTFRLCRMLPIAILLAFPGCKEDEAATQSESAESTPAFQPPTDRTTGPYVQMDDDHSVIVAWFTPEPVVGELEIVDRDNPTTAIAQLKEETATHHHQIRIEHLEPDGNFAYRLTGAAATDTEAHALSGIKRTGEHISFAVFGDSGSGKEQQYNVAARIADADPDYIIHTGDVVYPDGADTDYVRTIFEPYARLIDHMPIFPCLGNHDTQSFDGAPYLNNFILPRNGPAGIEPERCYTIRLGDVFLVSLDLTRMQDTIQSTIVPWVRDVLAASDAPWKIVFSHYPVYTSGTETRGVDTRNLVFWSTLFDETGVDLYLAGHNHQYERSHPIREGEIVEPGLGTVYVVSGNGGMSLYKLGEQLDEIAGATDQVYGFTHIVFEGRQAEIKHIDEHGRIQDEFAWSKRPSR